MGIRIEVELVEALQVALEELNKIIGEIEVFHQKSIR